MTSADLKTIFGACATPSMEAATRDIDLRRGFAAASCDMRKVLGTSAPAAHGPGF